MLRRTVLLLTALASTPALSTPTHADPAPGGFMSPNVRWVANIPIDSPGVGARVVRVGAQTRLYVTGVKGLSIYDVSNPALPVLLGATALPHWENESVAVSADGSVAFVAAEFLATYVVDTSLVTAPRVVGTIDKGSHTATCADPACHYLYGSDGWTYDVRDRANPQEIVPGWQEVAEDQGHRLAQGAHYMNRDDAGLVTTDTMPRLVLDPRRTPARPKVLGASVRSTGADLAYQHNNLRPGAAAWRARRPGDTSPQLRPGELLLGQGETNFTGDCDGESNGPFATWRMTGFEKGVKMRPIEVFRPLSGNYLEGDPAVNALGCSGHWFDYRKGLVAAGWYEHGIRFLRIDERSGRIKEVGFFQPVATSASAAYWVSDDYVYTVDYARGIDILHFDRSAALPTQAQIDASWLASLRAPKLVFAERERYFCRLAQRRQP